MTIKNQYRLIHDAIHGKQSGVRLGRAVYEIQTDDEGRRYVDYDNIRFIQQKKDYSNEGRRAYKGERLTWMIPFDTGIAPQMIESTSLIREVNNATIALPTIKKEEQHVTHDKEPAVAAKARRGGKKLGK